MDIENELKDFYNSGYDVLSKKLNKELEALTVKEYILTLINDFHRLEKHVKNFESLRQEDQQMAGKVIDIHFYIDHEMSDGEVEAAELMCKELDPLNQQGTYYWCYEGTKYEDCLESIIDIIKGLKVEYGLYNPKIINGTKEVTLDSNTIENMKNLMLSDELIKQFDKIVSYKGVECHDDSDNILSKKEIQDVYDGEYPRLSGKLYKEQVELRRKIYFFNCLHSLNKVGELIKNEDFKGKGIEYVKFTRNMYSPTAVSLEVNISNRDIKLLDKSGTIIYEVTEGFNIEKKHHKEALAISELIQIDFIVPGSDLDDKDNGHSEEIVVKLGVNAQEDLKYHLLDEELRKTFEYITMRENLSRKDENSEKKAKSKKI